MVCARPSTPHARDLLVIRDRLRVPFTGKWYSQVGDYLPHRYRCYTAQPLNLSTVLLDGRLYRLFSDYVPVLRMHI